MALPIPLNGHLPPPFPTHALPHTLRHYVEALSQALAVSPHVGAMLSLAVIAAAVAKNLEIRAAATWMEPVNLYVLIALPPASRKSSAFSRAMAPLRLFERGEAVRVSQEIATQGNVRRIKELHLARLQEKLASLDPAEQAKLLAWADEAVRELKVMKQLVVPRLVVDDATPEKRSSLLAEWAGRLAVMSVEDGLFETFSGP